MSGRADIARSTASPRPARQQVPGLVVFLQVTDCLQSDEMATAVGLAIDKKDTTFRDWLLTVYDEVEAKVTAEELRILKEGA